MEHKTILGGEQYLPFARSCIKRLRATGLAFANQKFETDDTSITVRITPGHEYIRLEGKGKAIYAAYPGCLSPVGEIYIESLLTPEPTAGMVLSSERAQPVKYTELAGYYNTSPPIAGMLHGRTTASCPYARNNFAYFTTISSDILANAFLFADNVLIKTLSSYAVSNFRSTPATSCGPTPAIGVSETLVGPAINDISITAIAQPNVNFADAFPFVDQYQTNNVRTSLTVYVFEENAEDAEAPKQVVSYVLRTQREGYGFTLRHVPTVQNFPAVFNELGAMSVAPFAMVVKYEKFSQSFVEKEEQALVAVSPNGTTFVCRQSVIVTRDSVATTPLIGFEYLEFGPFISKRTLSIGIITKDGQVSQDVVVMTIGSDPVVDQPITGILALIPDSSGNKIYVYWKDANPTNEAEHYIAEFKVAGTSITRQWTRYLGRSRGTETPPGAPGFDLNSSSALQGASVCVKGHIWGSHFYYSVKNDKLIQYENIVLGLKNIAVDPSGSTAHFRSSSAGSFSWKTAKIVKVPGQDDTVEFSFGLDQILSRTDPLSPNLDMCAVAQFKQIQ